MNFLNTLRGDDEPSGEKEYIEIESNEEAESGQAEPTAVIEPLEEELPDEKGAEPLDAGDPIEQVPEADSESEAETQADKGKTPESEEAEAGDPQPEAPEQPEAESADNPARRGKHAAPEGEAGNAAAFAAPDDSGQTFVNGSFGEIPTKKRHRGLKAFGITVGVLAAVALIAYIAGAVVFMGRMLPNTKIGEYDISLKSDEQVVDLLEGIVSGYQLDVIGGGFAYRTNGAGIGLSIDSAGIVNAIHDDLNPWAWPLLILEPGHDEADLLAVSFKQKAYEANLEAALDAFNEAATPPVNATIAYDEKSGAFIVKPEEQGTQLDKEAVLLAMSEAIGELEPKLVLGAEQLVQPTVFSDDEKLGEAAALATGMVSADLTLTMGDKEVGKVDGDTLSTFISIGDDFTVLFDEEEMDAWVGTLAEGYNTVGTERTFTRADGKAVTVPPGGSYGWEIDTESLKAAIIEGIKAGSTSVIDVPCIDTAAEYNGAGQRDWGNRYVDVDLAEQHVRFYGDDGSVIWESDCISGSPDGTHDTVPGTWYVNAKESPSKLIGYEHGKKIYETSVTYWMPFEGNSIGFHDATWQPSFGGRMYANGYGSHGCVNLSYSAAQSLYDIIQVGDCVVVHF